eukprot:CAMPEP_0203991074 /NCGR_PEP_ID=MMETSP0360-20130528/9244_1 /ASSEMBLY_ACC=CAM_ASM_000342 /TAXON_ID=268821 /ORGANISM="Scrippsiella Hangoei, Strain SHTV-5" /LENGTH=99 /DNA_ID=CAMNT_0050931225 /DNA_START=61 /DNA_END=361 /DNA_ORIENTATION=+
MARVDAQELERLLDVDDFLPDTEVPSVSPPQPRALAGRAAAAGVVALGLLACLALACLEFHAARPRSVAAPELEMTDMMTLLACPLARPHAARVAATSA